MAVFSGVVARGKVATGGLLVEVNLSTGNAEWKSPRTWVSSLFLERIALEISAMGSSSGFKWCVLQAGSLFSNQEAQSGQYWASCPPR
ncbi:MAG: hypothetical protein NTW21_24380 [Verrucomicrobia bacterium]|nr:hypothetical protein [Verrucomicrobiota bacterium]